MVLSVRLKNKTITTLGSILKSFSYKDIPEESITSILRSEAFFAQNLLLVVSCEGIDEVSTLDLKFVVLRGARLGRHADNKRTKLLGDSHLFNSLDFIRLSDGSLITTTLTRNRIAQAFGLVESQTEC